jgi:hypothetical protein
MISCFFFNVKYQCVDTICLNMTIEAMLWKSEKSREVEVACHSCKLFLTLNKTQIQ